MISRFAATYLTARKSDRGSTLIEMLTVIVILGILLALAAPYIISDMHRSQDTETKRSLSLAFVALKKNALATTTSDCSPYSPPCVPSTDTARQELQTALPTSTFSDGLPSKASAVSGHIGVETDAQNEAVLCVKSDSGNFFSIRYVSNGTNAGTYYGAGDSCTDGSNPATPGIPYDTGSGPNPSPAGQGTNECTGDEWSCGAGSPASGGGGGSGGSDVSNPVNLTLPAISGNPGDSPGNTLNVSTGTWDADFPPSSYTYQWYRNGVAIAGATNNTYIDTASDMNTNLTVGVSAYTASGGQTTVFSPSFLAANPPTSSAVPTISGTAKDAQTLTATTGSWNGTPPFSYSYQWQTSATGSGGWTALSGATSSTYTVQSSDIGNYLRVEVTATNSAGSNAADSAATVQATNSAPTSTSLPTATDANGAPLYDGDTVSGTNGSWVGTGPFTYSYQWERCNIVGASCSNIGSATTINYTATSTDVGSTLRLQVTANGPGGSTSATSSQTTVVVANPPVGPSSPSIQSFYPTQAPVGNHVTILGNNLTGTTGITVNGTSVATFTVVSANDIDFVIPTGATTGKIVVTTPQGTASSSSNLTIGAVSGVFNINDFAPTSGMIGTAVGISGYGLTGTTAVKFNGVSAIYKVISNYDIIAVVPPGATTGKISVTNGSTVSSANNFTVTSASSGNPPTIQSFSPMTGTVGSHVAILGSDFLGATAVKLNGTTATYTVESNNLIDMTVPAGATTGTISVTTPKGTATSLLNFTVGTCGSCSFGISDFVPQFGPVGTVVGISGYGFSGATAVKFNGTSASYSVISTSSILAVVPPGATTGLISVTNGTTVSSATSFTITTPPASGGPTVTDTNGAPLLVGDSLTSTTGTWTGTAPITYTYQWEDCDEFGNSCSAIGGATSSGYTATASDYGHTLRLQVTGTNAGGSAAAISGQTTVVGQQAPANTSLPTITDLTSNSPPEDQDALSVSNGSWSGTAPLGYTYVWKRCDTSGSNCNAIPGAGSAETLLNGGFESGTGSWTATSATVTQVSSPVAQGSASGRVVSTAAATFGVNQSASDSGSTTGQVWDGMAAVYATGTTVGKTFQLQLAEEGGASGNTSTSTTVTMVAGWNYLTVSRTFTANDRTAAHLYINILGGAVGDTVYVDMGYLSLDGSTYSVQTADVGSTIRATVTAMNPTSSASATSAQTSTVVYMPVVNLSAPVISDSNGGSLMVGDTFNSTNGSWNGSPTITYTYKWQSSANGSSGWSNIGGATSSSYVPVVGDIGNYLRDCVTATNPATPPSLTSCSNVLGPIVDLPKNSSLPVISPNPGILTQVVSTTNGSWTGTPTIAYSYQWESCDSSGNNCSNINGATSSSYTTQTSDSELTVRVVVTATNAYGSNQATSAADIVVPDLPIGTVVPYAGASIPSGWVSANGLCVPTSTYPQLYAVIGINYGTGGAGTYCYPNLTGTLPIGQTSSGTGSSLGTTGGALDASGDFSVGSFPYTFSWSETPSAPTFAASTTNGGATGNAATGGSGYYNTNIGPITIKENTETGAPASTGTVTANTSASVTANYTATDPPFMALTYIVKAQNTATAPCGAVLGYAGSTLPSDAKKAVGQASSGTLASCLGSPFGATLPDLRGRFIIGQTSSGTGSTFGGTGGTLLQSASVNYDANTGQSTFDPGPYSDNLTITAPTPTTSATSHSVDQDSGTSGFDQLVGAGKGSNNGLVVASTAFDPGNLTTAAGPSGGATSATYTAPYFAINQVLYNDLPYWPQTGTVVASASSTVPTGWLRANGQAVSRSTYSALFAAIGTTYGAGDGSTTFNLPNLQGSSPLGLTGSGTGSTLGETGGTLDATPSVTLPGWTPTLTIPAHTFSWTIANYTNSVSARRNAASIDGTGRAGQSGTSGSVSITQSSDCPGNNPCTQTWTSQSGGGQTVVSPLIAANVVSGTAVSGPTVNLPAQNPAFQVFVYNIRY